MNEGHKFISLGYLVLPSLNKAFTYLLTNKTMISGAEQKNTFLLCSFDRCLIIIDNFGFISCIFGAPENLLIAPPIKSPHPASTPLV